MQRNDDYEMESTSHYLWKKQRRFLASYKATGGNPSQLIRIALEKEIVLIEKQNKEGTARENM